MIILGSLAALVSILFLLITESPILSICFLATFLILVLLLYKVTNNRTYRYNGVSLMTTILFLLAVLTARPSSLNRFYETGVIVFVVGHLLNWLVILSNGLKMPVINKPAIKIHIEANTLRYKIMDQNTRLKYLADIIYFSKPFPEAFSVGDVFISLGLWTILFGLIF